MDGTFDEFETILFSSQLRITLDVSDLLLFCYLILGWDQIYLKIFNSLTTRPCSPQRQNIMIYMCGRCKNRRYNCWNGGSLQSMFIKGVCDLTLSVIIIKTVDCNHRFLLHGILKQEFHCIGFCIFFSRVFLIGWTGCYATGEIAADWAQEHAVKIII